MDDFVERTQSMRISSKGKSRSAKQPKENDEDEESSEEDYEEEVGNNL